MSSGDVGLLLALVPLLGFLTFHALRKITAPSRALGPVTPARWLDSVRVRRTRRELWRHAAEAAGLDHIRESDGPLTGQRGRFYVLLENAKSPDGTTSGTGIVVSGLRRGQGAFLSLRVEEPFALTLGSPVGSFGVPAGDPGDEGADPLSLSGPGPWDVDIGDADFDRAVSVHGSPTLARAVLDADTRRAVADLVRGRMLLEGRTALRITGELKQGELRIVIPEETACRTPGGDQEEVRGTSMGAESRLPEVLNVALDLAARLEEPADLAQRIAENTAREPKPRVRRLNLRMLFREFPEHPATREALLAARDDPDAEVRLEAGRALGEEGREVLLRLAMGEGADDQTAASAVAALGARLSVEDARRILHEALLTEHTATAAPQSLLKNALHARREATARACLAVLGERGDAEAIEALGKILTGEEDEIATVAAGALARIGDPRAEKPILHALAVGSQAVRLSAARALGRVGTAASVAPLREAESRGGEMRGVARQAVAEIQSRLAEASGAAPGQLSLAGGEAGQVSLVEERAAGRLALSEPGASARDSSSEGREPSRLIGTGVPEATEDEHPSPSRPRPSRSRASE